MARNDAYLEGGPRDGGIIDDPKTFFVMFPETDEALIVIKSRASRDEPFTTTYQGVPTAKYRREIRTVYVYEGMA